jgi:tRNA A-37 threonylcarbamoyl transferase component Bud32
MKLCEHTSPENSLIDLVERSKDEILQQLQASPARNASTGVIFRPFAPRAMHKVGTLELRNNGSTVRCFAKSTAANYRGPQRLEREEHILRDVTPKICVANQNTRTPRVLAFFPDRRLLLLEFIDGSRLKNLVFARNIPHFVSLAGEWLARLHATTESGEANPFAWLETALTEEKVRTAFEHCSAAPLYQPIVKLLGRFHQQFPNFRQPLCLVHGEFTSLHVLTKGESIYVIDFGSSRTGFGSEDVAFFSTFHNALLPWRQIAGYLRYPLSAQSKIFLQSYFKHCGRIVSPVDEIVLRFANIRAIALHGSCWEVERKGWAQKIYACLGRQWIRRQVAAVVQQEFRYLQQIASTGVPSHNSN